MFVLYITTESKWKTVERQINFNPSDVGQLGNTAIVIAKSEI